METSELIEEPIDVEECRAVFNGIPYLSVLADHDIESLTPIARARELRAGDVIFYEDDGPDGVYFLCNGAVEIFKSDQSGKKLPLSILRESGVIGEMGLLNKAPRTATARALTPVRVMFLKSEEFNDALERGSLAAYRLVYALARVLAERLAEMDNVLLSLFEHDSEQPEFRELTELRGQLLTHWTA